MHETLSCDCNASPDSLCVGILPLGENRCMAERVGQFLGNYQVLRLLGRGAFAEVYLAEHRYLEVPAAIKVLHVRMEPDTQEYFLREARTIAHLQHPHIVRVLDFGFQDQTPFLVMEYTPNGTLRTRHPKRTRLPLEQIIRYVKQIAPALDYAHQQRVIHRDVKPENILLSANDKVVLSDFGIAVVQQSLDSLSTQTQAGTPVYMAPEQIRGKPSPASDQYALGVLVYEWLCGEPPFRGSLFGVLSQHLHEPPPSLCARLPFLPQAVEDAVFGTLAKEPQERFVSVQDFAEVLEELCDATQPLSVRLSSERLSQEQIVPSDTLPLPIHAPSPKAQDRPPSPTHTPVMARKHTEDTEALGALQMLPAASQTHASSQHKEVAVSRTNGQRLLRKVRAFWIAGVLEHSLHGTAFVALGLQEQPDAVANPWQLVLQHPAGAPRPLLAGTRIKEVYDAAEGELLILGAPGSGKTTLLLELARDLLDRAERDEHHPLPVVFNLSSWASKQQPLADWLVEELTSTYQVPRKLGQTWVDADQILPLLDGLDEVAPRDRTACIETINTYRQEHGLLPLVVCSRSADYLAQTARVHLGSAVAVQPLTPQQVDDYLAGRGEPLWALRMALHRDAALRELTNTPLMLSILTLTYHGMPVEDLLRRESLTDRQRQIFEHYVERMLRHRGAERRYTPEQTTHWLSWLARQLKQHNQTVFYIEHLQPDWLLGDRMRRAYDRWAVRFPAILIGVLVGFLVSLFLSDHNPSSLSLLFPYGLVGGLIGELLSGDKATQFTPKWTTETWRNIWGRLIRNGSLRDGILLGCGMWLIIGASSVFDNYKDYVGPIGGPIFGAIFGVGGSLLSISLRRGQPILPGAETPARSWRNKWYRILQAGYLKNGLLIGGYFVVAATLSYGLVETLGEILSLDGLNVALAVGPSDGLSFGLKFGLGAGLIGSLLSVIFARWNRTIQPAEVIHWSWRGLWHNLGAIKHLRNSLLLGGLFGLTIGMIKGFSTGVSSGLSAVVNNGVGAIFEPAYLGLILSDMWMSVVSKGLGLGLSIGLSYWFLLGLLQGVSSDSLDEEHRLIPNQGIRDSALNSLRIGIVGALVTCFAYLLTNFLTNFLIPFFVPIVNGSFSQYTTSIYHTTPTHLLLSTLYSLLSDCLFVGLVGGLIAGLLMGELACIRHYVLRFLLWRANGLPRNMVAFLDEAAERLLLRKLGGGYIFIHRLLLDYFASLEAETAIHDVSGQSQQTSTS